jgi:hypothetical protein
VQHDGVRGALGVQYPKDVGMGVPVVDDQSLAVPLGDRDVRPETRLLGGQAIGLGAEPVPRTRGSAARTSISRSAESRSAIRGASLGCSATVATMAG